MVKAISKEHGCTFESNSMNRSEHSKVAFFKVPRKDVAVIKMRAWTRILVVWINRKVHILEVLCTRVYKPLGLAWM